MLCGECFILMGMGGFFILLGLATIIWGKHEEKSYHDFLSTRADVREYLEPPRLLSLKIGGWLAIAIGLLMLGMGGGFWLWG